MKEILKKWLLKEEQEIIKIIKKELEKGIDKLNKEQEELQIRKEKQILEEIKFRNKKDKLYFEIKEKYKKQFLKEMKEKIQELDKIKKYNLYPGKKLWSFKPFDEGIEQIEIESIIFKKDKIGINGFLFGEEIFKTKKEAIEAYNKKIENLKLKK